MTRPGPHCSSCECIIGNFWTCPSQTCPNGKGSQDRTKPKGKWDSDWWAANTGTWAFKDPKAAASVPKVPLTYSPAQAKTLYAGSPWVPGQYKVAEGCFVRQAGVEFEYSRNYLHDTDTGSWRNPADGGSADLVVELVADLGRLQWRVRTIQALP